MSNVKIDHITKYYNNQKSSSMILENISFEINHGSFTSLLGPSGCGKTTLLRIISGLEYQSSGNVYIDNKLVYGPSIDRGIVFQDYSLFPWMNVIENVSFGLNMKGYSKKDSIKIAEDYIKLVKLDSFKNYFPRELSGGMKQRVAIARALAVKPKILLMDEPFSALDEDTRYYLQDELLKLWKYQNLTILFVTHSIEEAVYLSDNIIILNSNPGSIKKTITLNPNRKRIRKEIVLE